LRESRGLKGRTCGHKAGNNQKEVLERGHDLILTKRASFGQRVGIGIAALSQQRDAREDKTK
jgi:hypothetical protein